MQINADDDDVQPDELALDEPLEVEFGEQEEAAQAEEWAEDAKEGGASES